MGQICNFDKGVKYACSFGGETSWKMGTWKTRCNHLMALRWWKGGGVYGSMNWIGFGQNCDGT